MYINNIILTYNFFKNLLLLILINSNIITNINIFTKTIININIFIYIIIIMINRTLVTLFFLTEVIHNNKHNLICFSK